MLVLFDPALLWTYFLGRRQPLSIDRYWWSQIRSDRQLHLLEGCCIRHSHLVFGQNIAPVLLPTKTTPSAVRLCLVRCMSDDNFVPVLAMRNIGSRSRLRFSLRPPEACSMGLDLLYNNLLHSRRLQSWNLQTHHPLQLVQC